MDEPLGAEDPQALSISDRLFEYRPFVPPDSTGALGAIDRWRRRTAAERFSRRSPAASNRCSIRSARSGS